METNNEEWNIEDTLKNKKKWNIAHFPVGTVFQYQVFKHEGPIEATVTGTVANGPNSYVLITDTPSAVADFVSVNISHVTRIIKRGNGSTKLQSEYSVKRLKKHFDYVFDNTNALFFGVQKHHSKYFTMSLRELIYILSMKYTNDTMLVNLDKLVEYLLDMGYAHTTYNNESGWHYTYVSKKKLNIAIKRVINKCLLNRVKTQKAQNKEDNDKFFASMDRDHDLIDEGIEKIGRLKKSPIDDGDSFSDQGIIDRELKDNFDLLSKVEEEEYLHDSTYRDHGIHDEV